MPRAGRHTAMTRSPILPTLRHADYVFVRHGARRVPLTRPYDGPFRVVTKDDKFFVVKVGTKEQVVSVDRLKPAFGFADPTPSISGPKAKKLSPATQAPKPKAALDPTAEEFVPTATKSRSGCVIWPPAKLNL